MMSFIKDRGRPKKSKGAGAVPGVYLSQPPTPLPTPRYLRTPPLSQSLVPHADEREIRSPGNVLGYFARQGKEV